MTIEKSGTKYYLIIQNNIEKLLFFSGFAPSYSLEGSDPPSPSARDDRDLACESVDEHAAFLHGQTFHD